MQSQRRILPFKLRNPRAKNINAAGGTPAALTRAGDGIRTHDPQGHNLVLSPY